MSDLEVGKPECFGKYLKKPEVKAERDCDRCPVVDPCEYTTRQVEMSFPTEPAKQVGGEQLQMDNRLDCFGHFPLFDEQFQNEIGCRTCVDRQLCETERINDDIRSADKPLGPSKMKQVGGDHYDKMKIEPWDVIDTWPGEQGIGWYRGNALKYLMRMGTKGSALEDAKKARHYIEKLIEVLENA